MKRRRRVTKDDWKINNMPVQQEVFDMECHLSEYNMRILKEGHCPEMMEDKWFYYYEDGKLYLHRSWTGNCIFILDIDIANSVIHVVANRDDNQYTCKSIKADERLINNILRMYAYQYVKVDFGVYHGSLKYFLDEFLSEEDDDDFEKKGLLDNVKSLRDAVLDDRFEDKENPYMDIGRIQFPGIEICYYKSTDMDVFLPIDISILWERSKVLIVDFEIPEILKETGWHCFSLKEGFNVDYLISLLDEKDPLYDE